MIAVYFGRIVVDLGVEVFLSARVSSSTKRDIAVNNE